MKFFRSQTILWLFFVLSFPIFGRELKVKRKSISPAPAVSESKSEHPTHSQLLVNIVTPLVFEDFYDHRFSTIGLQSLFSIPLSFGTTENFLIKFGVGVNFSALAITTPQVNFSHFFVNFPLHLHWQLHPSSRFSITVFAGVESKLLEYDTRPTADGGFHLVNSFTDNLHPDFGTHVEIKIGDSTALVGVISYLYLGGGLAFSF